MDSSSRRFPFSVSGSRSSFTTPSSLSSSSSSSSLSSSRQYGRDRLLGSSGCYPRASSTLKPELEHQSSRYLSSARASSSSSSRSPSWKLPSSLSSSSTSYERPWADSKLGSRDKLGDSTRLGSYTGLLKADDGDSKRAKLTYGSRGEYSKASSTSIPGSLYSSSRFSSGADATDSTRSLCRLRQTSSSLSSSSSSFSPKPVLSRGELETRPDPGLASLGEGRLRSSALTYQPDRYSSTYAQGARPKETPHSSTSSFTRESSLSRHHLSSSSSSSSYHSSAARDLNSRVAGRTLSGSSLLHPSHPTPLGSPEPTSAAASPSASSVSYFYSFSSRARREPSPPSAPTPPAPEAPAGPEGRLSTRRLLSRLFSRRSSQDSSSSSSSSSSSARPQAAAESPPPTSVAVASDPEEVDEPPVPRDLDSALDFLRRRRLVHSRNQETQIAGTQSSMDARRASTGGTRTSTSISTGGASSWLSSSLRNHCTPLFSRQQRDGAAEKSPEESEDEEPEEEDAGAGAGAGAPGPPGPGVFRVQQTQGLLQDDGFIFSAHPRVTVYENILVPVDEAESRPAKSVPDPARDPERLRKIQESLLLEESDEEEGDLCRICQMGDESPSNPLIEPCRCTGSLQYVHQECIKKWLCSKISSGTNLEAITSCELCKQKLHLNIDNFDVSALYRTHVQSEYEFISSGLYLVVLLHLCEQRFSDVLGAASEAGFFNLARTLDQHMDIIESGRGGLAVVNHHHHDDDDEEDEATTHDTRPLIDFSDLDDIEEED